MLNPLAAQRRERLGRAAADAGIARLAVYGNAWTCDFLRYVSDFALLEGHGLALLEGERCTLLLASRAEAQRARLEVPAVDVVWCPRFHEQVRERLKQGEGRIGCAPRAHVPGGLADALQGAVDFSAAFGELMLLKLPLEIEAVRRATALADEGYELFRHAAREGRMEYEVIADMEAFFRRRGCPDNFMIMASGGQEVRAMHPPSERRLQRGDLVTTELTPCVDGYYAQICRTLVIGPPSAAQQEAFDVHLEALLAGLQATRPGATAGEVARAENDVFRAHGLAEYITSEYTRVRGHGLGLYVDSRPSILEGDATVLAPDMSLIVHPNGYHPACGYLVLGDMVVLRPGGHELLTQTPRELFSV